MPEPRTVVVTGAAQGIGAAVAARMAGEGWRVIGLDLQPGEGQVRLDVSDPTAWTRWAATVDRPVHGLVTAAGIAGRPRLLDVTADELVRVYEVNVVGTLLAIQAVAPAMVEGASVVAIGSIAALTGHHPIAYTASKWAVRGLVRAAATELGGRGIRVNAVHPGYVETEMAQSAGPVFRDANVEQTPLGRVAEPAEVAGVVAFLLGDDSAFVTGAELPVDGGFTAHGGSMPLSRAMRRATS